MTVVKRKEILIFEEPYDHNLRKNIYSKDKKKLKNNRLMQRLYQPESETELA